MVMQKSNTGLIESVLSSKTRLFYLGLNLPFLSFLDDLIYGSNKDSEGEHTARHKEGSIRVLPGVTPILTAK